MDPAELRRTVRLAWCAGAAGCRRRLDRLAVARSRVCAGGCTSRAAVRTEGIGTRCARGWPGYCKQTLGKGFPAGVEPATDRLSADCSTH